MVPVLQFQQVLVLGLGEDWRGCYVGDAGAGVDTCGEEDVMPMGLFSFVT